MQFEAAFPLGPADGRYLRRAPDGEPERVIVVATLGARERRRGIGRRKPQPVPDATEPEPVPTSRVTLIRAQPLASEEEAERWLEAIRGDRDAREGEVELALSELNAVLRAHRAAAADPYIRELERSTVNVVRIGYGSGDQVADGHFSAAYEVPEPRHKERRVDMLAPQERLAAVLSGSDRVLACEELVLRARADLDAARPREAALQARIALETLLAELPEAPGVAEHRDTVAQAANAALHGDPPAELEAAVAEAVGAMRRALARRPSS